MYCLIDGERQPLHCINYYEFSDITDTDCLANINFVKTFVHIRNISAVSDPILIKL